MKLNFSVNKYLPFSIFIGIVVTLWQYEFGDADQLDHLLFVHKAMNANFLNNDPYVTLAGGFSIRYYFAHFIAFFARFLGIASTYFIFTLLANVLTAIATFKTAKFISKTKASAWVACIFVLTLTTINMGDVPTLYATGLAPDRLAFPLVLFAFYAALKDKAIHVALFAGIASLFHIMLGFVTGAVLLLAMYIVNLLSKDKINWIKLLKASALLFVFSLFTLIPFYLNKGESISDQEFIQIYANFRVPHHLVPSYIFSKGIGIRSMAFFMGTGFSTYLLYKSKIVVLKHLRFMVFVVFIFFCLCLFGYLFIEVFPNRLGVLLQAFRYLTFVKWIALLLLGIYIGKKLSEKEDILSGLYLFASMLSPFLMCVSFCFEAFYRHLKQWHQKLKYLPYLGLILVSCYLGYKTLNRETVVFAIYLILLLVYLYLPKASSKLLLLIYVLFIFINIGCLSKANLQNKWFTQNFNPVFTFKQKANLKVDMALQIKQYLPKKAILLAPPHMLEIKTIAERASVVSFKAVPFGDAAIKSWKQRLDLCYGHTNNIGFEAEQDFIQNYKQISDVDLLKIKERYGISYAVLFGSTETEFPSLFQNESYKLVAIK